jgi:hypothetical protein
MSGMRSLLGKPDAVAASLLWLSRYHCNFMEVEELQHYAWANEDLRAGPLQDVTDPDMKAIITCYLDAMDDLASLSVIARLADPRLSARTASKLIEQLQKYRDRVLNGAKT